MTTVFMPLDLEMERLILSNMDLLAEDVVDSSLVELCAHVEAYKTVISRWQKEDYSVHRTAINFPSKRLEEYVSSSFARLMQQQESLLRTTFGEEPNDDNQTLQGGGLPIPALNPAGGRGRPSSG